MRLKRIKHKIIERIFKLRKKVSISKIIYLIFAIIFLLNIYIFLKGCTNHCKISNEIDVVYTWVNGSDSQFHESISKYNKNYDGARYDDKNELKYSLRSLEKYASWIRHVYIVTNGQIPHWLDLSYPKVSVVTHSALSPSIENLPTFSSSAIETFIHHIPNLSKRFLYMNDDIFLNAQLYPEDLYTESDGVRIYNAWTVPDCAVDCPWIYIGDGTCDTHCNIEDCQFDGGDCSLNEEQEQNNNDFNMLDIPATVYHEVSTENKSNVKVSRSLLSQRKKSIIEKSLSFKEYIKKSNFSDEKELKDYVEKYNFKRKSKRRSRKIDPNLDKNNYESTTDIFMHSLVNTNKILNRVYGFKNRYVLAHVGFLLDKDIMNQMHKKFQYEIQKTAKNRFRAKEDIQFAFLYYNFLMSEIQQKNVSEIFDEFDTDKSETLSDREIRTLLTRIYPTPLDWAAVKYVEEVLNNCSKSLKIEVPNQEFNTLVYERYEDSKMPVISKSLVQNCDVFRRAILSHFGQKSRYKFSVNSKREMHSNFMMLKSNITEVITSLDKFRRNPKKFNCINDNLQSNLEEENEIVRNLLEDFYISFFPYQSKFELPDHYRNKFLYVDDFEQWKRKKMSLLIACYVVSAVLIWVFLCYVCTQKAKCVRKCIDIL